MFYIVIIIICSYSIFGNNKYAFVRALKIVLQCIKYLNELVKYVNHFGVFFLIAVSFDVELIVLSRVFSAPFEFK